jgi:hypothetical protein
VVSSAIPDCSEYHANGCAIATRQLQFTWSFGVRRPRARLILSFALNREHPAEEVFVTGTFDDWTKSTKLDKVGSAHEKTVDLPKSNDKILYKVSTCRRFNAA